ncbi:hypothetical protein VE00_00257 [Pseudogymnoascus sp. WSF 3629]|nr:hypothetical protein VE00_00257 [Pseudogymnoascus sp. WSF 3629]
MASKTAFEHIEDIAARYEKTMGGLSQGLSRHIVRGLAATINTDSVVLDNACGTAIVTEEILLALPASDTLPTIHAVDINPAMVSSARSKPAIATHADRIHFEVMPAEKLTFPDATFTHSITNIGIFFFTDAAQGAREIFRTLKPGGIAVLTVFRAFPHQDLIRRVQAVVRPDDKPFTIPVDLAWFGKVYIKAMLRDAGFEDVTIGETVGHFGGSSSDTVADGLLTLFGPMFATYSADEREAFEKELKRIAPEVMETFTRGVGVAGEVEAVGLPMPTYVVSARK